LGARFVNRHPSDELMLAYVCLPLLLPLGLGVCFTRQRAASALSLGRWWASSCIGRCHSTRFNFRARQLMLGFDRCSWSPFACTLPCWGRLASWHSRAVLAAVAPHEAVQPQGRCGGAVARASSSVARGLGRGRSPVATASAPLLRYRHRLLAATAKLRCVFAVASDCSAVHG
jgi:hypothetical protein